MKIFFAGGENKSWLKAIENAGGKSSLYSYFYLNQNKDSKASDFIKGASSTQKSIFIDSGGYSAFTRGVAIDINEYSDWLLQHLPFITTYAVLDKIGDHKQTEKNQRHMESRGLKPLPVFHQGSPLELLKEMICEYKYIALGGMIPLARQKDKLKKWLDSCFSITLNRVKVHGFGMTGLEILKRYPFYSVDSTSWLRGSMRAEIYQFKNGVLQVKKTKNQAHADHTTIQFNDDGDKRWFHRVVNNAIEMQKFEKYITDLWQKRGITWN